MAQSTIINRAVPFDSGVKRAEAVPPSCPKCGQPATSALCPRCQKERAKEAREEFLRMVEG